MKHQFIVFAISVLFIVQAKAVNLGSIEIAGNACQSAVGTHELTEVRKGRFMVPTSLYLKKDEEKRIKRGICTFAVNLQSSVGKKIVVSNSFQRISLHAYPSQTKARIDSEIFRVGDRSINEFIETEAMDLPSKLSKSLERKGSIVETECGGSMILRGNLAATLTGTGKAKAYTRNLYLDIEEADCL